MCAEVTVASATERSLVAIVVEVVVIAVVLVDIVVELRNFTLFLLCFYLVFIFHVLALLLYLKFDSLLFCGAFMLRIVFLLLLCASQLGESFMTHYSLRNPSKMTRTRRNTMVDEFLALTQYNFLFG